MNQRTLGEILRERFPKASNQTLKRMAAAGRVRLGGKALRKLSERIEDGAKIEVSDSPSRPAERENLLAPLTLVHEDEDVLVVHKPAGLLTSTTPREKRPTALALVRRHVGAQPARKPRPVGLIHRLDADASGLLVFSKSDRAYRLLKEQFFRHTVERMYVALVRGRPEPERGRIESRLVEWKDGTVHSTRNPSSGQRAITDYEVVEPCGELWLVRLRLLTGRKHQIRVHLSEKGWAIAGDRVYGGDDPASRMMLAAVGLSFDHPGTGKRMGFEWPAEFARP